MYEISMAFHFKNDLWRTMSDVGLHISHITKTIISQVMELEETRTVCTRIIGRVDDVINVSGHRFGTAEIENAINANSRVIEVRGGRLSS